MTDLEIDDIIEEMRDRVDELPRDEFAEQLELILDLEDRLERCGKFYDAVREELCEQYEIFLETIAEREEENSAFRARELKRLAAEDLYAACERLLEGAKGLVATVPGLSTIEGSYADDLEFAESALKKARGEA